MVLKSREIRRAGHVACMGGGRGAYRVFISRPEGKIPLGGPGSSWEVNIKMDLKEVEWGVWNGLIWLRTGKGSGLL
jgi:hypothetical protein